MFVIIVFNLSDDAQTYSTNRELTVLNGLHRNRLISPLRRDTCKMTPLESLRRPI